jgi:hypothetical protein
MCIIHIEYAKGENMSRGPKSFYDGKVLFETYHGWGAAASLRRLAAWAEANGMVNPAKGKANMFGVRQSMWRWGAMNPEESYEIYKRYHLERYPVSPIPTIQEYVKDIILAAAHNNPGVLSRGDAEKLLMRFGLSYEAIEKVKKDDVIQVVKPNHHLFQRLLTVESYAPEEGLIEARIWHMDDTFSNHQLNIRDVGIVGRVIV